MLLRVEIALLLAACWPNLAVSQQRPCTVTAHLETLDPSSFPNRTAAADDLSQLRRQSTNLPYAVDRNAIVFDWALPGYYLSVALWAPARDLPPDAFAAHDHREPVPVLSAEADRGPRRIVFVVEKGKKVSAAARQVETAAVTAILSNARTEDSFALLTAGGSRVALPLGSGRDAIRRAVEDLSRPGLGGAEGRDVRDALLEAATWFGSPQPGDSIFLLSRPLGGGRTRRVHSALGRGGIRLFSLGLGTLVHSTFDALLLAPPLELSEESGGGWEQIEGLPRKDDATDAQIELARREALELYGMIKTFYVVRLERTGPHVMIEPSLQVIDQMPWARVLYPRPLPVCPPPAGTAPAEGNKKK